MPPPFQRPRPQDDAPIGDRTYADLPPIGQPDDGGKLNTLITSLGIESGYVRTRFTGNDFDLLNRSQNLRLYGDPEGRLGDTDKPVINITEGAMNVFIAQACRVPPSITVKSASVNEDGHWVTTKDTAVQPQLDPTGQPLRDPDGFVHEPIPMAAFQVIDDAAVDRVPSNTRVCINTETCIEFVQTIHDIKRRQSEFDSFFQRFVLAKLEQGWPMGIFNWDADKACPEYVLLPPQQWYPDEIQDDVAMMDTLRVDYPIDVNRAKCRYPKIAKAIDEYASRTLELASGNQQGYSTVFTDVTSFQRPIVTLVFAWLRHQYVPMTLAEAVYEGFVQEVQDVLPAPPALPENTEGMENPVALAGQPAPTTPPGTQQSAVPTRRIIHTQTQSDLTASFNPDGSPAQKTHDDHPHREVIRQTTRIRDHIVDDVVCPHWDIPVFHDVYTPVLFRPFGLPATVKMAPLQIDINRFHGYILDNARQFRSPSGFIEQGLLNNRLSENVPESIHMEPGVIYTYQGDGSAQEDITKKLFFTQPPPMPPALPALKASLMADADKVFNMPSIRQGTPPPGVNSGVAISQLQSESSLTDAPKIMTLERAVKRMSMLALHAEVNWMSVEDIWKIYRKYPKPIIQMFLDYLRGIVLDVDVALASGVGQVKAQRDAQVRADVGTRGADGQPLLDTETAREKLDYDNDEIQRRLKTQREQAFKDQQAMAPPPMMPQPQPA
jgi:hypothetical protein